ncbi:MAG: hypothetical protein NTX49_07640 [Chlamydiae bacterium]|nr:hypothetical protein [Chlamydiota bacterium]
MTLFDKIARHEEFSKDLKKLLKRFPTLETDLESFTNAQLVAYHKFQVDNNGIERLQRLGFEDPPIFKATKFACRSLKGRGVRSGIRITYAYIQKTDTIQLIQIYYKEKDDTKEDRERIKSLFCC